MRKPLIHTITLIVLLLLIFFVPIILLLQTVRNEKTENQIIQNEDKRKTEVEDEKIVKIDREPAQEGVNYFEDTVLLNEQVTYYTYPLEIDVDRPPELVIYSHGQLRRVTENLEEEYMRGLRDYAALFASEGYAFVASNEHGDNWGGQQALNDIQDSRRYLKENNFSVSEKFHMVGFSMGGLSSINFAVKNPEKILSIALLAPTPNMNLKEEDIKQLHNVPINIYHGDNDVNIPLNNSIQYKELFKRHGKDVELLILGGLEHYDLEFFNTKDF